MLAEASTTDISKTAKPQTFEENKQVAKRGGKVAGIARQALEAETGKPVITEKNAFDFQQLVTDIVEDAAELPGKSTEKKRIKTDNKIAGSATPRPPCVRLFCADNHYTHNHHSLIEKIMCGCKLAGLFTRKIKPLSVKVCIGHALQLRNGALCQLPHFSVHIRPGGQHPRHRPAAVRSVVHTNQIFFFYAEIHASNLHFVLFAAGRCLFSGWRPVLFRKAVCGRKCGLADALVPVFVLPTSA